MIVCLDTDYQAFFGDPAIRTLSLTAAVCERAALLRAASNFVPGHGGRGRREGKGWFLKWAVTE